MRDDKNLEGRFERGEASVKMPQINTLAMNVDSKNLKIFPHMVKYKSSRENSTSILERNKSLVYRNMKRCILETNLEGLGG